MTVILDESQNNENVTERKYNFDLKKLSQLRIRKNSLKESQKTDQKGSSRIKDYDFFGNLLDKRLQLYNTQKDYLVSYRSIRDYIPNYETEQK